MKAQIAMLEVFLSALILSSVAGAVATLSYSMSAAQSSRDFNIQNAFYDFTGFLYRNSSYSTCLLAMGNCASPLLAGLDSYYSLSGLMLAINNRSIEAGKLSGCIVSKTECFPVKRNGAFTQACLTLCG